MAKFLSCFSSCSGRKSTQHPYRPTSHHSEPIPDDSQSLEVKPQNSEQSKLSKKEQVTPKPHVNGDVGGSVSDVKRDNEPDVCSALSEEDEEWRAHLRKEEMRKLRQMKKFEKEHSSSVNSMSSVKSNSEKNNMQYEEKAQNIPPHTTHEPNGNIRYQVSDHCNGSRHTDAPNSEASSGFVSKILHFVKGDSIEPEDHFETRTSSVSSTNAKKNGLSCTTGHKDHEPTLHAVTYSSAPSTQRQGSASPSMSSSLGGSTDVSVNNNTADKLSRHDQLIKAMREKYSVGEQEDKSRNKSNPSLNKDQLSVNTNDNDGMRKRSARSVGSINQMRQMLADRGERVEQLDIRSQMMKESTGNLSTSMSKLADKYKNRKWYEM